MESSPTFPSLSLAKENCGQACLGTDSSLRLSRKTENIYTAGPGTRFPPEPVRVLLVPRLGVGGASEGACVPQLGQAWLARQKTRGAARGLEPGELGFCPLQCHCHQAYLTWNNPRSGSQGQVAPRLLTVPWHSIPGWCWLPFWGSPLLDSLPCWPHESQLAHCSEHYRSRGPGLTAAEPEVLALRGSMVLWLPSKPHDIPLPTFSLLPLSCLFSEAEPVSTSFSLRCTAQACTDGGSWLSNHSKVTRLMMQS